MISRRVAFALAALAATVTAGCSTSSPAETTVHTPVTTDPNAQYESASFKVCSDAWRSGSLGPNDSIDAFATLYASRSANRTAEPAKWQAAHDGCARGLAGFLTRP